MRHLAPALVVAIALLTTGCDYLVRVGVSTRGAVVKTGANFGPAFSSDGRYIAFTTTARDLVPGEYPFGSNAVVRDLHDDV